MDEILTNNGADGFGLGFASQQCKSVIAKVGTIVRVAVQMIHAIWLFAKVPR